MTCYYCSMSNRIILWSTCSAKNLNNIKYAKIDKTSFLGVIYLCTLKTEKQTSLSNSHHALSNTLTIDLGILKLSTQNSCTVYSTGHYC
jgi:hypothetical protein